MTNWGKYFLYGIGSFLLIVSTLLTCIDEFPVSSSLARGTVVCGIIVLTIMVSAVVAVTVQGCIKAYFQRLATINEYYLNAQLKYFRAYQVTQRETRRIRHDMKNHMTCLHNLLEKERCEEAPQYIETMMEQVNRNTEQFHTGHNMIDAILNEKDSVARQEGIALSVEGMPGLHDMEPIDVCTIFSNALDNAIEAQRKGSIPDRWIRVAFKRQHSMQYIRIENPVSEAVETSGGFITNKDRVDHGFGLENMKLTVEKYGGQLKHSYKEGLFILEILFATE